MLYSKKYLYLPMMSLALVCWSLALNAGESFGEKKLRLEKEQKKAQLAESLIANAEQQFLTYKIGPESYQFLRNKKRGITITEHCGDDLNNLQKKRECLALVKLELADIRTLTPKDLEGGKNPGSVLCQKQLQGEVVFGKDTFGHTQTFCRFADNSIVRSDSINYFGSKKNSGGFSQVEDIDEGVDGKKMEAVLDASEKENGMKDE